jgi:hypothetical protein
MATFCFWLPLGLQLSTLFQSRNLQLVATTTCKNRNQQQVTNETALFFFTV